MLTLFSEESITHLEELLHGECAKENTVSPKALILSDFHGPEIMSKLEASFCFIQTKKI